MGMVHIEEEKPRAQCVTQECARGRAARTGGGRGARTGGGGAHRRRGARTGGAGGGAQAGEGRAQAGGAHRWRRVHTGGRGGTHGGVYTGRWGCTQVEGRGAGTGPVCPWVTKGLEGEREPQRRQTE